MTLMRWPMISIRGAGGRMVDLHGLKLDQAPYDLKVVLDPVMDFRKQRLAFLESAGQTVLDFLEVRDVQRDAVPGPPFPGVGLRRWARHDPEPAHPSAPPPYQGVVGHRADLQVGRLRVGGHGEGGGPGGAVVGMDELRQFVTTGPRLRSCAAPVPEPSRSPALT